MWPNPIVGKDSAGAKCRTYEHHWTSGALYAGIKGRAECNSGRSYEYTCHGGGLALGAYRYVEGYSGWRSLAALSAGSMVSYAAGAYAFGELGDRYFATRLKRLLLLAIAPTVRLLFVLPPGARWSW